MKKNQMRGFTLVELLVVIAIIALLASLVTGGVGLARDKQSREKAKLQISLLSNGLEQYKLDQGNYPASTSTDGTNATNLLYRELFYNADSSDGANGRVYVSDLSPNSKNQMWLQGTGDSAKIIDPWQKEYFYRTGDSAKNPDFDLWSSGKDMKTDSAATQKDDITQ